MAFWDDLISRQVPGSLFRPAKSGEGFKPQPQTLVEPGTRFNDEARTPENRRDNMFDRLYNTLPDDLKPVIDAVRSQLDVDESQRNQNRLDIKSGTESAENITNRVIDMLQSHIDSTNARIDPLRSKFASLASDDNFANIRNSIRLQSALSLEDAQRGLAGSYGSRGLSDSSVASRDQARLGLDAAASRGQLESQLPLLQAQILEPAGRLAGLQSSLTGSLGGQQAGALGNLAGIKANEGTALAGLTGTATDYSGLATLIDQLPKDEETRALLKEQLDKLNDPIANFFGNLLPGAASSALLNFFMPK